MTVRRKLAGGFSLIELLVVIALLSVLAALAAGTYFRIRSGQMVTATESTLQKLNTGLDRIWSAERDKVDKEFKSRQLPFGVQFTQLMTFAGGPNEIDRARSIWLMLRMKNEFPQTFSEARAAVNAGTFSLRAKNTFAIVPNATPANADEANLQAAALLYLILTEKGSRGEVFDADTLNAFVKDFSISGGTFKVFVDTWGTPITYVRYMKNDELNDNPYSRNPHRLPTGQLAFGNPNSLPNFSNNPFDEAVKLRPSAAWSGTQFDAFASALGLTQARANNEQTLRHNFLSTIVSAGPNRAWDSLDVRAGTTSPHSNIGICTYNILGGSAPDDNLMGYRLRSQGARGD